MDFFFIFELLEKILILHHVTLHDVTMPCIMSFFCCFYPPTDFFCFSLKSSLLPFPRLCMITFRVSLCYPEWYSNFNILNLTMWIFPITTAVTVSRNKVLDIWEREWLDVLQLIYKYILRKLQEVIVQHTYLGTSKVHGKQN